MSTTYDLLYRGGVSKENNIRYLTAETPPSGDNSNKVPTTEWVQEKIDDVEAAVSGGMNATVKATTYSGSTTYAPSGGGTWWCYGTGSYMNTFDRNVSFTFNKPIASGGAAHTPTSYYKDYRSNGFAIKIA